MAARAAIRDVGRTLDMSYTFCDGLSKLIPNKPGQHMTIALALEQEPILAQRLEREDEVKILLNLAQNLEGLTRNVGMHAGGVLIAPGKLTDFCPLYQQSGSPASVSQFDKDDVEAIGLVKFDFLGLATLTILENAKVLINQKRKKLIGLWMTFRLTTLKPINYFLKEKRKRYFNLKAGACKPCSKMPSLLDLRT